MADYLVAGGRNADAAQTVLSIVANATRPRRGRVFDISVGHSATPADNVFRWTLARITAAGTSTALTPVPTDPGDAATELDAGENHTVEPTYTAGKLVWEVIINQRTAYRWLAKPGSELVYPATASNGFGLSTPICSSAAAVRGQVYVAEL